MGIHGVTVNFSVLNWRHSWVSSWEDLLRLALMRTSKTVESVSCSQTGTRSFHVLFDRPKRRNGAKERQSNEELHQNMPWRQKKSWILDTTMNLYWTHGVRSHGFRTTKLVSRYFGLSQPQRITSGLKAMFNLSPFFFFFLPSTQVIKPQITPKQQNQSRDKCTKKKRKTYKNIKQFFFRRISPFGIALV